MSQAEQEKWNAAYKEGRTHPHFEGSRSVTVDWAEAEMGSAKGKVLDVGCGVLRNCRELAESGHEVMAMDVSDEAFRQAQPWPPTLSTFVQDLDSWQPPQAEFDLVIVVHYLNRELMPALLKSLKPGGLMALEIRCAQDYSPNDELPPFRLIPGELETLTQPLKILRFEAPSADSFSSVRALLQSMQ